MEVGYFYQGMSNKTIMKGYNKEIEFKTSNTTDKYRKNEIATNLIFDAERQGRVREFVVSTDKFKYKRSPILYVIGRTNPSDEVLYAVCWHGFSKREIGGITSTYKLYTRKQIEWFEFKKLKEIEVSYH